VVDDLDPLDALRAGWAALEPPSPDRRDPRDDEHVATLRAAWGRLVTPAPTVPWRLRRPRVASGLASPVALLAAAAAVLFAVLVLASRGPHESALSVAQDDGRTPPAIGEAGDAPSPPTPPSADAGPEPTHTDAAAPRAQIDEHGRLVLRRGVVRLMWLEPAPPPAPIAPP
jgi:hypothetical protein